jgi:hypothetical protein
LKFGGVASEPAFQTTLSASNFVLAIIQLGRVTLSCYTVRRHQELTIERLPFYHRENIMKTITHWIPAAFCAFISLIALLASVRSPDSGWWRPAFFAFLPMCFFFVGSATTQMHRELRELRQRITELEQKSAS